MLTGKLSTNAVDITISGDFSDLSALQASLSKAINEIHDNGMGDSKASGLLENFSEKVKRAYAPGPRCDPAPWLVHYHFKSTWVDVLIICSLLKSLSEYLPGNELDEVNVLLLEHILKTTTGKYPSEDLRWIRDFIGKRYVFKNLEAFITHFSCEPEFRYNPLEETVSGKAYAYLAPNFQNFENFEKYF